MRLNSSRFHVLSMVRPLAKAHARLPREFCQAHCRAKNSLCLAELDSKVRDAEQHLCDAFVAVGLLNVDAVRTRTT